jgi:hypothetical protein
MSNDQLKTPVDTTEDKNLPVNPFNSDFVPVQAGKQ